VYKQIVTFIEETENPNYSNCPYLFILHWFPVICCKWKTNSKTGGCNRQCRWTWWTNSSRMECVWCGAISTSQWLCSVLWQFQSKG